MSEIEKIQQALFARAVIDGFLQAMCLELSGEVPLDVSIKNQRLWLESEVRE